MFDLRNLYTGNLGWLADRTILFGKAGSHSYGLNTPESDNDYKGIAVAPREYYLGILNHFEQVERKPQNDDTEFVIYDVRKFCQLASNANPNILELLYLEPEDYLVVSPVGKKLIDNRDMFLSKKVLFTYLGYSRAQIKKASTHRQWLLYPATKEPQREDYGLPKDRALISKDQQGAFYDLVDKNIIDKNEASDNFLQALAKEKAYFSAHRQYEQYQEWKRSRNPKRAILEDRCGYDSKNASNLVRLMIQCREILTQGRLIVKRKDDRDFLLSIKNGAWNYEQVLEFADRQEKELHEIAKISKLPEKADVEFIDRLCVEIIEEMT